MNVLLITSNINNKTGWGRYCLDLTHFLKKNSINTHIVCSKKNNEYSDALQEEALPHPLSFKRCYLFSILYARRIADKFKKRDVDLIHCTAEPYAFITYLLSKLLRIKYVITIHGSYGVKSFSNPLYKFLQITAYKNARAVICVSNYSKKRILEYVKLENIVVIPNGVNLEHFKAQEGEMKKEDIVLSVGAYKRRKGFDVLLKSFAQVKKSIPQARCIIVGGNKENEYFKTIHRLSQDLGIEGDIQFLESLSDGELKEMYMKAKVFALTPVSDVYNFEGFGLIYLEANAYGIPVVGSLDSGAEDAISDGYNGLLAKARDSEDTAEKIVMLFKDETLREKMSKNAVMWAEKMSWENIIKEYIVVYKSR